MAAKSKWLDFHTHFGEDGSVNSPFAVVSISVEDVDEERMPNLFTIGLHPWQTDRLDSYRTEVFGFGRSRGRSFTGSSTASSAGAASTPVAHSRGAA